MVTISLCMIVKNEEKVLARCLDSLKDMVEEIIIVDTGSTDGTKQIATKYTDKVYDFTWNDDFSAARNFAFSKATKEYIYSADADEVIDENNRKKFMKLKEALMPEIEIVQMEYLTDMRYNTTENYVKELRPKLYKRLREFVWINPIHETVRLEPVVFDSEIEVLHLPYSNHCERDLEIFRNIISKDGNLNPKMHMMYARELYKSDMKEELTYAKEFFEKTLSRKIMTQEDFDKAHEAIAVLAKIYNVTNNDMGLVALLKYALGEMGFKEACLETMEEVDENNALKDGVSNIERHMRMLKEWKNQLSSEICLQVGIRLFNEDMLNESRRWLLRAIHKTIAIIDINSGNTVPYEYLQKIDEKKLVNV